MGKRVGSRRRGAGTGAWTSPSHRHHGAVYLPSPSITGDATIVAIAQAPGRSAPVVDLKTDDGQSLRLIAAEGIATGDKVSLHGTRVERGSVLSLGQVPDGTLISNIEVNPFDGGRLVRAAGASATVIAHTEREVTIQLPSGAFKQLLATCRAQIGSVAGGGRGERPFIKAGKKVHASHALARAPFKVRGVAMNPVNHPHGGGAHQHVGRPSTVAPGTWPGAKVGRFSPQKKRSRRRPGGGR
ncbi:MAG: 50S ribosomal protein L2 [Thermoplasmata archaeon]|nr:50S ribosomal protein L2 [Thermoplasmata archaeon]